jgi:hypothetical protein
LSIRALERHLTTQENEDDGLVLEGALAVALEDEALDLEAMMSHFVAFAQTEPEWEPRWKMFVDIRDRQRYHYRLRRPA